MCCSADDPRQTVYCQSCRLHWENTLEAERRREDSGVETIHQMSHPHHHHGQHYCQILPTPSSTIMINGQLGEVLWRSALEKYQHHWLNEKSWLLIFVNSILRMIFYVKLHHRHWWERNGYLVGEISKGKFYPIMIF